MRAAGWSLLAWLVPVEIWLRLELTPVPNVLLVALLLAVIGGLTIGIFGAGVRLLVVIVRVATPRCWARSTLPRVAPQFISRRAPIGGSGPRAPSRTECLCPTPFPAC